MTQPRLGFIGIGLMGDPMARRLLEAGFAVTVWNRTPEKCDALRDAGATVAASVGELVEGVDVVMLCLANTAVVESVVFGEGSLAAQLMRTHVSHGHAEHDPATLVETYRTTS